jgi:hypothetical protein
MEIIEKTFIVIGLIVLFIIGILIGIIYAHNDSIVISQEAGNIVCQKLLNNNIATAIDSLSLTPDEKSEYLKGVLICRLKTPTNDHTNLIQVIK